MSMLRALIFLVILGFGTLKAGAQEHFSEGVLHYHILLLGNQNSSQKVGTYTVTVKGLQVRRELTTDKDQDQTVVLFNNRTGTATMLKVLSGKKYAVPFSVAEWQKRTAAYQNYTLQPTSQMQEGTNGTLCQPATILYPDKNNATVCLATTVLDNPQVFERFPDLKTLPVSFELTIKSGARLRFELQQAQVQPVPEDAFSVPAGYTLLDASALPAVEYP